MKGDFTRFTHQPGKHYTRVYKQQGRVDLDADWNEQADLSAERVRRLTADVVGPAGLPKGTDGFAIAYDGADLQITPGRLYVDGLLCALEGDLPVAYDAQPDFPAPPEVTPVDGQTDLVYLDVWERHVTALEDPYLREVALGGPDTTTRVQTVCQVKVHPDAGAVGCDDPVAGWPPTPSDATLTTAANEPPASDDPCVLPPTGGYRGLENRLYRVEVHTGTDGGGPTFKWSRDNGAVVFAVEDVEVTGDPLQIQVTRTGRDSVLALRVGDWVEVLDDTLELAGRPGTLAQIDDIDEARRILVLSAPITGIDLARHPRVRRWDQPSDAIAITPGVAVALEDGVEVTFGGTTFRSGDAWSFAARTVTASVEVLTDAPPRGIQHRYARLALVTWADDGTGAFTADVQDCRDPFPSLTEICAEDICFDNTACQLVEADNVQEALDRLCEANDLRHHNKHLHGFGIVCGLQVQCGPDPLGEQRRHITVRDGYAIDCEGNNLILDRDRVVDVMDVVEGRLDDDELAPFLDESGNGELCLTLGLDENRGVVVEAAPYTPPPNDLATWLEGSLLMDFYNECIKVWVDLFRDAFTPPEEDDDRGDGALVNAAQMNFTTFLNLAWQILNPQYGRFLFLSPKEDVILRTCYLLFRQMLQSKTFCAMFDNARPFPDYPFPEHGISTIFGRGLLGTGFGTTLHTRMRLRPGSRFAYTVGTDENIHIYDVRSEEMVAEVAVPGGAGIGVRDVAFSAEGDRLYAIATMRGADTIFAIADLDGLQHTWRPVNVLCGVELVTLALRPDVDDAVYAVGLGDGLFEITIENINLDPAPLHPFNAIGHLVIDGGSAFATARAQGDPDGVYDRVERFDFAAGSGATITLQTATGLPLTGRDDIAVVGDAARDQRGLFVVTDPPGDASNKHLLRLNAFGGGEAALLIDLGEDTAIRLGHAAGSAYLLVAYEDCYRIRTVQMAEFFLVPDFIFPVQISPLSMVADAEGANVYVLNTISNTITTIPATHLNPDADTGLVPAPGSQAFLDANAAYVTGVYEAYLDLLGGLLQYLKDCFCDRFLIDCPTCDDEDVIYLGVVSIRDNAVYQVCNFSKRKYVKSWPLMGYWLSVVPIVPIIKQAMASFCCAILPDFFGTLNAPSNETARAPVKGQQVRSGFTFGRTTDFGGLLSEFTGRFKLAQDFSFDAIEPADTLASRRKTPQVKQGEVAGKSLVDAQKRLADANVIVESVQPYEAKKAGTNVRRLAGAPLRFKAGSRVRLFEQDGVVRYASLAPSETAADAAAVADLRVELDTQKAALAELDGLKQQLEDANSRLTKRTAELNQVRTQLRVLEEKQTRFEAEAAPTKIAALEAELVDLRDFRTTVSDFMRRSGPR